MASLGAVWRVTPEILLERVRSNVLPVAIASALLVVAAVIVGLVLDPTPGWANRVATWLTIAAAVIGVAAFLLAVATVPAAVIPEEHRRAIQEAEAEAAEEPTPSDEPVPTAYEPDGATRARALSRPVKELTGFFEWTREAVPIYVLADIVQWWRQEQEEGRVPAPRPSQRRTVGDIEHAIRKSVKHGAPAWYVKFAQEDAYYRVASGGQSRREADPRRVPAVRKVLIGDLH
jgi:hypothetical protein